VQGIIDLLAVDGNNAVIIDYKYSSKNKEELKNTYKKQLDLYAIAVKRALKLDVCKKAVLSLKTGEIVEID
jgi:ATP-dependent helicase/nuclease subunit A